MHLEIDRTSHRKLDAQLHEVDIRLQTWGAWARPWYAGRFPIGPATTSCSSSPRDAWPPPVIEIDAAVQSLYWRLASAVVAHYMSQGDALEHRALAYLALVQYFSARSATRRRRAPKPAAAMFRLDLDRARWSLRFALLQRVSPAE